MDAVTAFEHREDALRAQLEKAQDMQAAVSACAMALEQAACELAQEEQDELRSGRIFDDVQALEGYLESLSS